MPIFFAPMDWFGDQTSTVLFIFLIGIGFNILFYRYGLKLKH